MFASTEPSGFPAAILSRLQRYDVRRLTVPEIEGKLARILEADGRTADPAAIRLIARLAAGGMRDAESMLDQLLSSAPDTIDERRVRDLLGLADAEAVDGFVEALVAGDAATGIALLDGLEERGRDARILLDQAIDAIRARLVEELATGDGRATPGLAEAARRLAAIDPDRAGVGGLRLQLELALFASAGHRSTLPTVSAPPPLEGARPPVQRPAATTSQPAAPRAAARAARRRRPRSRRPSRHRLPPDVDREDGEAPRPQPDVEPPAPEAATDADAPPPATGGHSRSVEPAPAAAAAPVEPRTGRRPPMPRRAPSTEPADADAGRRRRRPSRPLRPRRRPHPRAMDWRPCSPPGPMSWPGSVPTRRPSL